MIGFLPAVAQVRAGETSADVTVRRWPSASAPAVRDLPAGVQVTARGHWHGWVSIGGPARGWIPVGAYTRSRSDKGADRAEQEIEPPANAAAQATGAAPAAPGERSEGDLMFDALNAQGDTPNADRIERVVNDAKAEVRR